MSLAGLYTTIYNVAQTIVGLGISTVGVYLCATEETTFSKIFLLVGLVYLGVGVWGIVSRWVSNALTMTLWFLLVIVVAIFQTGLFVAYLCFHSRFVSFLEDHMGNADNKASKGLDFVRDNRTLCTIILGAGAGFEVVAAIAIARMHRGKTTADGPLYS